MPHAKIIAIVNQKGGPGKSTWLRDRLLKLGAHVVGSVRRVVLHLPTATPDLHAWRHIALALGARAG